MQQTGNIIAKIGSFSLFIVQLMNWTVTYAYKIFICAWYFEPILSTSWLPRVWKYIIYFSGFIKWTFDNGYQIIYYPSLIETILKSILFLLPVIHQIFWILKKVIQKTFSTFGAASSLLFNQIIIGCKSSHRYYREFIQYKKIISDMEEFHNLKGKLFIYSILKINYIVNSNKNLNNLFLFWRMPFYKRSYRYFKAVVFREQHQSISIKKNTPTVVRTNKPNHTPN